MNSNKNLSDSSDDNDAIEYAVKFTRPGTRQEEWEWSHFHTKEQAEEFHAACGANGWPTCKVVKVYK